MLIGGFDAGIVPVGGHLLGATLAALVAVFLTGQALAIRVGTRDGGANDALVTVFLVNVVTFSAVVAAQEYGAYRLTLPSVGAFVGAGLVGTLIGTGMYFTGIERIGASRSDAIKASQPIAATLLAVVVLSEPVTGLNVVGIVLVVIGVGVLVSERSEHPVVGDSVGAGVAYPIAASLFFGMEPTFAKLGFRLGTPVFVGLLVKTITASLGLLVFLRWRADLTAREVLGALRSKWYLIAGVANTLGLIAYYYALTFAPVAVVIPLTQISPLLVMAVSYRYIPQLERITLRLVAGGVCIILGAIVVVLFG